tara:strand:+ start:86 stop:1024 length:939 start_codon:yes stop_codon:yes gene_type:complete
MKITKNSKIFLAGHNGMVGSSILKLLRKKNYKKIFYSSKKNLDLINQKQTNNYLKKINPDVVILAAARVGGIYANKEHKAQFIYENLMIQTNLINASYLSGVKKLIFLGSSCIYPKFARQPIKETELLGGKLEETNDAYAVAKIAGVKMCESYNKQYNLDYISLMPTNLYGPGDNYHHLNSHFFAALIKKIYSAIKNKKKSITIWGNGKAKRELMYVDDLASACEFFMRKKVKNTLINIGTGEEKTIEEFAKFIMKKLGVSLKINYDKSKPNGTPRKILNTNLAKKYGWRPLFNLENSFKLTYDSFIKNYYS